MKIAKIYKEQIESLKVGINVVPGLGIGYCKDKNDLENLKCYLSGIMFSQELEAGEEKRRNEKIKRVIETLRSI